MAMDELQITIERKRGVALYTQIKESIYEAIAQTPHNRRIVLPPQRDLATRLGVSRNTVSMAYAELEREGIVASYVGKGTVVLRGLNEAESHSRRMLLSKNIKHSVEEALSMGFTLDDYRDYVEAFLKEKEEQFCHIRLVFVECNNEQLKYFSEHLVPDPGVAVVPLLLKDIRSKSKEIIAELKNADCVVTSFYHKEELENLLPETGPPLVGIYLQPEMPTIVKIARIPAESSIGLIASSKQFLDEMYRNLEKMNIDLNRVRVYFKRDNPEQLRQFISSIDEVIVSPSRKEEVGRMAGDKDVVEFLFAPDKASINSIRVALLELRMHGSNPEEREV
ncbi:MAG: GntR family transcriptional regulator [Anaerohalosphaera sp.]|nr:GntR family transcriptional regulator [Anaerohalosphaera sp.]